MKTKEILRVYPISYRQLDVWTTKGYLGSAEVTSRPGSGKNREYTKEEVQILERMIRFVAAGVVPSIASAISRGDVQATEKLVQAMEMCK